MFAHVTLITHRAFAIAYHLQPKRIIANLQVEQLLSFFSRSSCVMLVTFSQNKMNDFCRF